MTNWMLIDEMGSVEWDLREDGDECWMMECEILKCVVGRNMWH